MRLSWIPQHCGSAEWRHVQHRGLTEGEEETRRRAKLDSDQLDASLIERAWRRLRTPDQLMLKWIYVWRSREDQICRRASIPADKVDGCYIYLQLAKTRAHRNVAFELDQIAANDEAPRLNSIDQAERL